MKERFEQFREMKAKHPDAVLMFRTNDCYELYGGDTTCAMPRLRESLKDWRARLKTLNQSRMNCLTNTGASMRMPVTTSIMVMGSTSGITERMVLWLIKTIFPTKRQRGLYGILLLPKWRKPTEMEGQRPSRITKPN